MANTVYSYSLSADFPTQRVSSDRLTQEIQASTIVTALNHISVSGNAVDIWFKASLSMGDETTLDGIVMAHSGEPLPQNIPDPITVVFDELSVVDGYTTTASTSFTPIEGTTYNEQTGNGQRSLVSSDANDSSAGTGARTIRITYYNEDLQGPFYEDVTLNGTTAVNTSETNIAFVERLDVLTVGSQLGNIGTVLLKASTDGGGVTVGSIAPGDNETNWVHHYIASGRVGMILNIYAHVKGLAGGGAHLRKSTPTIANTPENTVAPVLRVPPGMQANLELPVPLVITGPARLTLYAKPDMSSSIDWLAGFNYAEDTT